MEAIARRLEAIAIRLKAIASRLEALASRVEAIARRLALASRVVIFRSSCLRPQVTNMSAAELSCFRTRSLCFLDSLSHLGGNG